ncbi:cleavage and polyadenylation specificity factor subunit 2-like [Sycon ciliatum]|uniref:cleavage and polyadenylation specificity factor subunit 2-like n=1 Tax=Sycon ciliatum TaxID=27933 RepID=UPI0020AD0F65|eukprot:scpid25343/ scgid33583/ Cleavage and polyadenylation specificity factor subunit 2; Cleavage and polyadenylation specificity factor 100 kDa subunit
MTSIIKLSVISGARDESPPCYLLQVDDFTFLLDCGWDGHTTDALLEPLKKHINQIDAVLLTYPDVSHLGALPYLVGKLGLKCPVYATIPVYKMGQMFLYDAYQALRSSKDFDLFTLDDVDTAFESMVQLKYSQHVALDGKGRGLTVIPYPAGHMIGGTLWKIIKDGEDDILYAVDFNHKKERHLDGAVLETLSRPMLLITDTYNAMMVQARRKERDQALFNNILATLRASGNVLVTVDTAGRVLELCQLLDRLWRNQESGLIAYSLALLSNVSYNVVEFAKSQVEWMGDKIVRQVEDQRTNPFQFKHLHLCHSLAELDKVPEPKCVLSTQPDMESGFSRELFLRWAGNASNSVIMTQRTGSDTLAQRLIDEPSLSHLSLPVGQRVKLEGAELEEYQRKQAEEKRAAEIARRASSSSHLAQNDMYDSDDTDDEMAPPGVNGSFHTPGVEQAMDIGDAARRQSVPASAVSRHLSAPGDEAARPRSFFKQHKMHVMFPFAEEKIKWDDYGQIIKREDYVKFQSAVPEEKPEEDAAEEEMDDDAVKEEPGKSKEAEVDIPTKVVTTMRRIDVRCRRQFIDFEGRSDGESIKRILNLVKPRQLILVHGSAEASSHLQEYCHTAKDMSINQVWSPAVGDTVDATCESHIFQARLKDSLVTSLKFTSAKDMELAWVDARIHVSDSEIAAAIGLQAVPTLDTLPPSQVPPHEAVFLNEPRLSDFKQVLSKAGIQAEFSGGVLIINDRVAVRKNESGRIGLEGILCEEYYKVRQLLYEQYAIV